MCILLTHKVVQQRRDSGRDTSLFFFVSQSNKSVQKISYTQSTLVYAAIKRSRL